MLGAGTMGAQIALQAALHGVDVRLVDLRPEQLAAARVHGQALLKRRVARGALSEAEAVAALARVHGHTEIAPAAPEVTWAIEAIVEEAGPKREAFRMLDAALDPAAGMATNSSNIVVSRLADATGRPGLCCNMHFFHPVLMMDLCEVAGGAETDAATLDRAAAWAYRIGRHPVRIIGEVDGFVVNRILGAASAEAFALLADGVASVAAIDIATKAGLNWKMGPFELADFSGLDVVLGVRRDRLQRQGAHQDRLTTEVLERLVRAGRLGRKSGAGFYDYSTTPPTPLALPER